jgi:hypothetical protein
MSDTHAAANGTGSTLGQAMRAVDYEEERKRREEDRKKRPATADVDKILEARKASHGPYGNVAAMAQALKTIMHSVEGWNKLSPTQQESLDLVATKIGRILSGTNSHVDHWADLAGYATLVKNELEGVK